jgi:malonyl-CoA O-methyltransferase
MEIQKAYNDWSDTYDQDENLTRDLDRRVVEETLADLHFDFIFELGCGTGKNTAFLSQIGRRVHAVDFSPGMIAKAKEKVTAENVEFERMDITQAWRFDNGSFDLIVCCLVLEHIADLSFVFSEASRALKAKGRFFVDELHPFRQYDGKKAGFYRNRKKVEVSAFVHHISDFLSAATNHGLRLVSLKEHWHTADQGKPPRLASFMFEKG